MASATTLSMQPADPGVYHADAASKLPGKKVAELLQDDIDKHHVFFNHEGFHNHIPHHMLTLYALSAPDSVLEKQYKENANYQRKPLPVKEDVLAELKKGELKKHRGKENNYSTFLQFYKELVQEKGLGETVNEALFKGDDQADDLLGRMFAGFLHPIIQFGFGIEFNLPAVVAEGLAQASVHDQWYNGYVGAVEKASKSHTGKNKPILEIIEECAQDEKLKASPKFEHANKIRDGILKTAADEMIHHASQWVADPKDLEKQTAEMISACVFMTAAAQNPPKQVKLDFFYMHTVTSSIFFSAFLKQDWLSAENKARLLNYKVWSDVALYVSRGSPKLLPEEIANYLPRYNARGGGDQWESIFHRVFAFPDDGHAAKFLRAVAHAEQVCKPYEGQPGFRLKGDHWQTIGNMIIDSVEAGEPEWVRSTGFPEAWEKVPDRGPHVQL